MLLDKNGNPIKAGKPIYEEVASASKDEVMNRYVGEVRQSLDEILLGRGGFKAYRGLLTDDQVMSTYQQRRRAITSREWIVTPGGTSAIDKKAAEWLEEQIKHLDWDATLDKMHYGIYYGFGVGELMYAKDGGRVMIDRIRVRDRERFTWGKEFDLRLVTRERPLGEKVPPRKFWTYTSGSDHDDDPWGFGLAHYLFWPVLLKRNGVRFMSTYLEKWAHPTPIGRYQPGTDPQEQRKLLSALSSLSTDLGIIVPEGMTIEAFEAKRSGSADYEGFLERWDRAIAKINLSQTMTTEDGSSLAQGQVHMDVRDDVVKGDADLLCASFNYGTPFAEGPAQWLTEWNFPGAKPPSFWYKFEEEEDRNQVADRDLKLFQAGWQRTEESHAETYGEGYERRVAMADGVGPRHPEARHVAPLRGASNGAPVFAEGGEAAVSALADRVAEDATPLVGAWVARIEDELAKAGSLAEFAARLAALPHELDDSAIAEIIAAARISAHSAGKGEV